MRKVSINKTKNCGKSQVARKIDRIAIFVAVFANFVKSLTVALVIIVVLPPPNPPQPPPPPSVICEFLAELPLVLIL